MKRITITYRMSKPGEDAENCITVPMSDEMAKRLRDYDQGEETPETIDAYLEAEAFCGTLARFAGYDASAYVGSEVAAQQYEEVDI